jgi:hypothetical protein
MLIFKINLKRPLKQEEILWTLENQEQKISQYGGSNLRYNQRVKPALIRAYKVGKPRPQHTH